MVLFCLFFGTVDLEWDLEQVVERQLERQLECQLERQLEHELERDTRVIYNLLNFWHKGSFWVSN